MNEIIGVLGDGRGNVKVDTTVFTFASYGGVFCRMPGGAVDIIPCLANIILIDGLHVYLGKTEAIPELHVIGQVDPDEDHFTDEQRAKTERCEKRILALTPA